MQCNPDDPYDRRYFFDDGIHFECRGCGFCCTGDPGIIRISSPEIRILADFLNIPETDLIRLHLRSTASGLSIAENDDGSCRFYDQGCGIYPVRPLQCRTFPFWFSRMRSLQQWQKTLAECPGLGTGPLYSRNHILETLSQTMVYLEPMEEKLSETKTPSISSR